MSGLLGDDDFNKWIILQMKRWIEAKIKYGKFMRISEDVPDFQFISGKKQLDYKIRKRENDQQRHGVALFDKLAKSGEL